MMIVNLSTMVENNGLPVFINNLNKHHTIPLMASVTIKRDSEDNDPSLELTQFFVIAHTRDCDGTPLYHLANTNFNIAISLVSIFRNETPQSNVEMAKIFNKHHLLNDNLSSFSSLENFFNFHDFTKNFIFRNYSESSLLITQTL